jgi:tRNA(His) 5'-end guanylyltransferase
MDADDFAAAQREREWFHSLTVPPGMWTVIRADGRGFSKLTGEHFSKPFDDRMRDHMTAAATALMTEFDAVWGCTHSDEISVVLPPGFDIFSREVEKLVSVSAGICSLRQNGSSAREATSALRRATSAEQNELLWQHGINFNDVPAWHKRGAGLSWQAYEKPGVDPRTGAETTAVRRRLHLDNELPVKDEYRALVTAAITPATPLR